MADIYDVARESGVSTATVSRVINGSPKVNSVTRERVLEVIDELGFVPNAFARGLNFNSMGLVGILCAVFGDVFYSQAVSYIEKYLRSNGLNAVWVCTGYTHEGKKDGMAQLINKNVDAVVLIGTVFQEEDSDYIAKIAKKLPVFTVNAALDIKNVYSVKCDERQAAKNVALAFAKRGCRAPVFFYEKPNYGNLEKLEGFRSGLIEAGIEPQDELFAALNTLTKDAVPVMRACLKKHAGRVDAIFTANDALAVYAMKAEKPLGMNLPVVGFNNSSIAELVTPELTSVDNMLEEMCKITVDHLVMAAQGKAKPEKLTVLQGEIVYRETF